jgi:hypothetical protein
MSDEIKHACEEPGCTEEAEYEGDEGDFDFRD